MPQVRVTHVTQYRYRQPVQLLAHRLMIRPRDSHDLRLLETSLSVSPPALTTRWAHDVFGNSVCYLTFPPGRPIEHLRIVSKLDLRHYPGPRRIAARSARRNLPVQLHLHGNP